MPRLRAVFFVLVIILMLAFIGCSGDDSAGGDRGGDDDTPPVAGDDDDDNGDDDSDDDNDDDDDDDSSDGRVEIVEPENGDVIIGYQVGVEVRFNQAPDNYQLLLDGDDVTENLSYFPETGIGYSDLQDVQEGEHELTAKGWFDDEVSADSVQFSTTLEGAARIELTLSEYLVPTGTQITASWVVYDEHNNNVTDQVDVDLSVSPSTGVTINGDKIRFTNEGTYTVTASTTWDDAPVSDSDVVVVFDNAEINRVEIECTPDEVKAGEGVNCSATVYDEDNNVVPGEIVNYTVDPSQGATVNGSNITLTYAANVTITGTVAGTNISDNQQVLVNPGDPFDVELTLTPDEINVDETCVADAAIVDEFGNPISDDVILEVFPSQNVEINGNEITPHVAGTFTVTAWDQQRVMQDNQTLTVIEASPPYLEVTSPERGEFVTTASINVQGKAWDDHSSIDRVEINGISVSFNPTTGQFSYALTLASGLNHITVAAWDEFDNTTSLNLSVLYAGSYTPNGEAVLKSVGARINHNGLDTIEGIGEELIEEYRDEIMNFIPNPLFYETYDFIIVEVIAEATVDSVDYDPVILEIQPIGGAGLQLSAIANNLDIAGNVSVDLDWFDKGKDLIDLDFNVLADSVGLTAMVLITVDNGSLVVELTDVEVVISNFVIDLEPGLLEDIMEWIIGLFTSDVVEEVKQMLEDLINEIVPPLLQLLLNQLDLSFDFELLTFEYHFNAVFNETTVDNNGLSLWLDAITWYGDGSWAVGPNTPDLPGSLRTPYPVPTFGEFIPGTGDPYEFGVTISDDILNQILHVAHRSGMLSLNLDQETLEMLGIEDFQLNTTWLVLFMPGILPAFGLNKPVELRLRPKLPPVFIMNPVKGLETEIQMGDFILEWWCEESTDVWTLFAEVALTLFIPTTLDVSEEQTISLEFGEIEMYADLFNEPVFDIGDGFFEDLLPLLVELLIPALLNGLLEEIPIPSFEGYTLQVNAFMPIGGGNDWAGLFGDLVEVPPLLDGPPLYMPSRFDMP